MTEVKKEDDGKLGRFVIYEDGKEAGEMTFTWEGDKKLRIDHTSTGKDYRGKGYAKNLVLEAVDFARENNVMIRPVCPYAKSVLESDKKWSDLLY